MDNEKPINIRIESRICTIEINRPQKMNTLNPTMLQAMADVMDELENQQEIRVVVIRGTGEKAFCAGFDISEIPVGSGGQIAVGGQDVLEIAISRVRNFKYPVIAMINGFCIGGGLDLAVNCDFRIALEGSRLGITPAKLGLVYHASGLNRFVRLVGIAATKELFYTGRLISAERALEMGLVDKLAPAGKLEEAVYSLAEEISENAPMSVCGCKYIINRLVEKVSFSPEEEDKIRQMTVQAFNSEDMLEGQMAFLQKRKPRFKGR